MTTMRGIFSLMADPYAEKPPYQAPDAWQLTSAGVSEHHEEPDDQAHNGAAIEMTHERARELLLRQSGELLPAAEANALADHLLTCDACYRFAQDVAARQHRQTAP